MAPSASADEPCPTPPLCVETDADGVYRLSVPPLSLVAYAYPEIKPLEDCFWEVVEVDFGDGSPDEIYSWDATQGLSGSHAFPAPGTYTVHVNATQGHHVNSGEPCPDFPLTATVTYPIPPDPPPKTDPPKDPPFVPTDQGGTEPDPIPPADHSIPNPWSQPLPVDEAGPYWRRCRAVRTHLVSCRNGRRLARVAGSKLDRPGSTQVGGFECRLSLGSAWPLVCRRGEQRVIAPLAR